MAQPLLPMYLLAAMATTTAAAASAEVTLTLAQAGKPAATIVIAKQPTRAAQFAAYELQWHLKQITGGDFSMVRDDEPVQGLAILVGDSQPVRALKIQPDQLDKQAYLIRFTREALVLVGRDKDDRGSVQYDQTPNQQTLDTWPGIWDEQGTMYAVYDFLERYCNVRWFTPTEFGTDCPRQATLSVTGSELQRCAVHEVPLCRLPCERELRPVHRAVASRQRRFSEVGGGGLSRTAPTFRQRRLRPRQTRVEYAVPTAASRRWRTVPRQPLAVRLLPPILGRGERAGAAV